MTIDIVLQPLVPWPIIALLGGLALALLALDALRRGRGWLLRTIAVATLAVALLNPLAVREQRQPRPDLALVVVDDSLSQSIGDRRAQGEAALQAIETALSEFDDLELRVVRIDRENQSGMTKVFEVLDQQLGNQAEQRLAATILITDGQIHDVPTSTDRLPSAPIHALLTGSPTETDRRLMIQNAPAFGLVGKTVDIVYRVDDLPPVERSRGERPATVQFRINGIDSGRSQVPTGQDLTYTLPLDHAGPTVLELEVEPTASDVAALNNRAAVVVNGVRERLRVLLVSGQPHAGERTWRNLLKSDPAVDLVHFTILRPPEKQDVTPLRELSLIVFPVQELFENRLYDFDLVIFDRYVVRGVLPSAYLSRLAEYVEDGGAVLLAVGPEFAGPFSLYRTPLGRTMPGVPTGRIIEQAFYPGVTELGLRHPVTSSLVGVDTPGGKEGAADDQGWGRWFRIIDVDSKSGDVLMHGPEGEPLLIVDRVGKGRIAQIMSDQIWLWARGFEGGGPQAELLRRLAHWLMKEPELEEENLSAVVKDDHLEVERRSLDPGPTEVIVTSPSGATQPLTLVPDGRGSARARMPARETGLYRVSDGTRTALTASGTSSPPEFSDLRAAAEPLSLVADATGGSVAWIRDGVPEVRRIEPGGRAAGDKWIGLVRNHAYTVTGVSQVPFLPGLLILGLVLAALALAWCREGR